MSADVDAHPLPMGAPPTPVEAALFTWWMISFPDLTPDEWRDLVAIVTALVSAAPPPAGA